jgi:2-dehydro-3-deoxygluconokinase
MSNHSNEKILCFGEVMLRLTPPDHQRIIQTRTFDLVYGGSEANVAVSLARMGLQTSYITRVPDNDLGQGALSALRQHNVDVSTTITGGDRLGLYFLEMGAGRRGSKILYDRQGSGMATIAPGMISWATVCAGARWLHWSGITPALSEGAAATTAEGIAAARQQGLTISCDLNFRANLWKYGKTPAQVMPELVAMTDVMLGDATAFELYFGITADSDEALMAKVAQHFPQMKVIAMTRREGASASHNTYQGLLYDGKTAHISTKYDMPDMLDRIGGGDAFMAGLIYGLIQMPEQPSAVINYATAAATLKHYTHGDFNLSTVEEVRNLMSGNSGGRVNR